MRLQVPPPFSSVTGWRVQYDLVAYVSRCNFVSNKCNLLQGRKVDWLLEMYNVVFALSVSMTFMYLFVEESPTESHVHKIFLYLQISKSPNL